MTKKIYKNLTSVSQNVYIDKLHNIFDKCNNKYCSAIKMKPIDVKISTSIDLMLKTMIKFAILKLLIMWELQNMKKNLQKVTFQEVFLEQFTKNNCKTQMEQYLGMKK